MERNVSNLIQTALSSNQIEIINRAVTEAASLGAQVYLVGGFVRDLVMGREGGDLDITVEGDAVLLARALARRYGGKVTTHGKFGTAKWDVRDFQSEDGRAQHPQGSFSVDLISARSEIYKRPAALPSVKPGTIEEDLRRRDFTVNALAIRMDQNRSGEVIDMVGSWDDIQMGLIRVLHSRSFIDDPTRMYRAIRYEQRYGFKVVKDTLELIPEGRAFVAKLSAQRIRHELDLILGESKAGAILARLMELKLLSPIHAALKWDRSINARFQAKKIPQLREGQNHIQERGWLLWIMSLSKKDIESLHIRLHFNARLLKLILASSKLFHELPPFIRQKPSKWVGYLEKFPLPAVYAVYNSSPESPSGKALGKYLSEWRHIKTRITGYDLKKRGLHPGPQFREILSELRDGWLNGQVKNAMEERRLLEQIIGRMQ